MILIVIFRCRSCTWKKALKIPNVDFLRAPQRKREMVERVQAMQRCLEWWNFAKTATASHKIRYFQSRIRGILHVPSTASTAELILFQCSWAEACFWRDFVESFGGAQTNINISLWQAVAGLSLGEYTALCGGLGMATLGAQRVIVRR